jgi:hypothetical protein
MIWDVHPVYGSGSRFFFASRILFSRTLTGVGDIRKTMSLLTNKNSYSLAFFPRHWFEGGYSTGNVSTRRRIALTPLFQDTDWVEDIQKMMSLLKKNNSYSLAFFPRHWFGWG